MNMYDASHSRNILPTAGQLKWADCEVGVIIHLDVQVFEPSYDFRQQRGYTPGPSVFNPSRLDTDQWVHTAKTAGAKYAVFVAKHCSGFSLWPTKVHDYNISSAPWRKGRGDIVSDFFQSCERYGIKPGLYYSASCNAYMGVDSPGRVISGDLAGQKRYNSVVEKQLAELWSNYGDIFEIWFDGGIISPEQGGPDIIPILEKFQPDSVVFQGPFNWRSLLRWVGNERGEAPYPCWSRTNILSVEDGTSERFDMGGKPDGSIWAPAESDMPNRNQHKAFQGGWFWREGEDHLLYSLDHLVERYYSSVGRNTNLLLGMVIDNRGLVPDADSKRFAEFGIEISRRFNSVLCRTSGTGDRFELTLSPSVPISQSLIMEDISKGERIRRYTLEAFCGNEWQVVSKGSSVGHKRIERFSAVSASKFRLTINEFTEKPVIKDFAVFR